MKAERVFFTTLITLDAFFVAFFFGFNSRHVPVIDPTMPPISIKTIANPSSYPAKGSAATQEKEARPVRQSDVGAAPDAGKHGAAKGSEATSEKGSGSGKGSNKAAGKGAANKPAKPPAEKKTTSSASTAAKPATKSK
ncbi:MAG: hypothetical protein K2W95_12720 [Candidatus Obscuribacterales bacterium]|nr:hypothetical protein [Candidatus Obscuribacterales bacterium]